QFCRKAKMNEIPECDKMKKDFRPETISFFSRLFVFNLAKTIGAKPSPLTAQDKQIWGWIQRDAEAAVEADEEDNCSEENEKKAK
ncbi:hypothetical protein PRIPAC_97233, partial [Pristionchus pacificus]|uniref:Uncharacterized protein n=1 Tax=Pristionchus pacificus TaxID=54126 RepID=A0A2A6B2L1_PRIPA